MRPAGRDASLYFDYPQFAFLRPPELRGEQPLHPVLIVGAGPVGVTAALELARHGIASVVIDDKNTVNDGSRAICIARHSFECFQQLGVHERFLEHALPWTHGTSYYRDKPVYRLAMPHGENERFHPMYNLQQQYIELFLIERAMEEGLIDLRWGSKLIGFSQDGQSISATVLTAEGEYTLRAQYALAADGARSEVRRSLDLKLEGDAYEGRYVIADVQMKSDYPTERRAFFDPVSNPGLTILVHKQPQDIWRIDYQLNPGDDEEEAIEEARIRERVGSIIDMLGDDLDWDLEWWSVYKAYTLALKDYRCGRTLFIGDAAHLVPIFGVRGLNSGLADAMNAAWKLAAVLHGDAPDALLDSYSPERRGATMEVFRNAAKSTRFMTPPSRGYERMREAVLSLSVDNDFARALINPRQSEPYTYVDSALTHEDDAFVAGPRPGDSLCNHRLADGSYLLDYLGPGFTMLLFTEEPALTDLLSQLTGQLTVFGERARLIAIGAKQTQGADLFLYDEHASLKQAYGAKSGSVYLVRPDRHVAARCLSCNRADLIRAFEQALARQ